jgi:DNA gyrase/topoisomerase IV subunit A
MSDRSGIGMVEIAILEALESLGARADDPHVGNAGVLAEVERRIGLAPGHAYPVLADLARQWTVPVRLVQGQGNYGELRDDEPASHFRYTESRLSQAGEAVLAAERGDLAPVPVGLINGNTYADGTRPPFRPQTVIEAIRQVIQRPQTADTELTKTIGMPDFLTGCTVTGDLAALAAGHRVVLQLQAHVRITDDHRKILVEFMPPNASRPRVTKEIFDAGQRQKHYPGVRRHDLLPVANVADISRSGDDRFLCLPEKGTTPERLRELLLDFEGITTNVSVQLPESLPTMIKRWVKTYDAEDLPGSLDRLETAIHGDLRTD